MVFFAERVMAFSHLRVNTLITRKEAVFNLIGCNWNEGSTNRFFELRLLKLLTQSGRVIPVGQIINRLDASLDRTEGWGMIR